MHATLEAEELSFLRDLMRREIAAAAPLSLPLPQASPLSTLLKRAEKLQITASYEHHELHFKVVLEVNEQLEPELRLLAPDIIERGRHPQNRPWRFRPDDRLQVCNDKGEDLNVDLLELSADSLALRSAHPDPSITLQKQMELQLTLPDGQPLALSARWVRDTDQGAAAYTFDLEPGASDSLRWFLLDQHPALTEEPDS